MANKMKMADKLTEKMHERIKAEFRRFDTNGDMYIEPSELRHQGYGNL